MGINFLRPFLQSLCANSPWDYAVFWKLKHQNGMDLVWEDGFYDIKRDSVVLPIEDSYLDESNKTPFSTFNSTLLDGTHGDYPVGLAVTEMSSDSHVIGKGVVGKAAFTGNACWIYSDEIITDVFNSVLVPEYPEEWLLQFVAGIKTILLLPVMPEGVLQLGSVEMVAEDVALVAHLKDKFEAYNKPDPDDPKYSTEQFSLLSTFTQSLEEPSGFFTDKEIEDQNAIHAVRTKECNLISSQIMPIFMIQDFCNASMRQVTDTPENATESEFITQPIGMINVPEPCQLSSEAYKFPVTENDIVQNFHHEEKLRLSSYVEKYEMTMYREFVNELMDFRFEDGITEPTFPGHDFDSAICDAFQYTNGISLSDHDAARHLIGDREPSYSIDVSAVESVGYHMKEVELEHLLEAAAANATMNLDNDSSINSNITSVDTSLEKNFSSSKKRDHLKGSTSVEEDKSPWNFSASAFIVQGLNGASNLSASVSPVESKISTLSDKRQRRKGYNSVKREKLSMPPTDNKRRARLGDNRRQRPRDRQLIQERIKELRELVPNSEKCSIDGLLDKTIKHMLFLRDVTNQSDKLRQQVSDEEADERTGDAEVSYSHQNGTSWAVELGSEQQLCPIVVKDLDQPGHMLIEMLCDDHDRFLEISDAIHRLKLTILKGAMEKTTENSWARFIVETSGSFHRLDIFWPLMQLLQQSQVPI